MAFRDFNGAGAKLPEQGERTGPPAMMPLSLELVPPSLCHSFGVALSDAQSLQQTALGLGGRPLTDLDFRAFRAQDAYGAPCLGAAQHMHPFPMGMLGPFGQLPGMGVPGGLDSQAYAAQASRMLQLTGGVNAPPAGAAPGRVDGLQPSSSQAAYYGAPAGEGGARHSGAPEHAPQRLDSGLQGLPLDAGYGRASFLTPQDVEGRLRQAGYGDVARGVKRPMDGAQDALAAHQGQSMEPVKRSRLVWTRELHQRFEQAVDKAGGIDVAVPKSVLEHMSIPGLTRDNVASHLQKHRMHRKRDKEAGAAASVCLSREPAVTASDTFGNTAVQRSSTDIQDVSVGPAQTSAARPATDALVGGGGDAAAKGFTTASMSTTHMTSDSGSRRTAFAALRSHGQYSTPDSRDTAAAGEGAPGTMASSMRHGSGGDALLTVAAAAAAARGEDDTETGAGGSGGGGGGSGSASETAPAKGLPGVKAADGAAAAATERPTLADCHS